MNRSAGIVPNRITHNACGASEPGPLRPRSLRPTKLNKEQETHLLLTISRRICTVQLCNGVADPLNHAPPHMCFHAEFGHCRSNHVRISRENLKVGPLG